MPAAIVPDLAQSLRNSLLANQTLASMLPIYLDSPTIFTRRPVPPDAPYPMIVVSPDIAKTDTDGLADLRPIITRDVTVYGSNDTSDNYRDVEEMAYIIFSMFHRNPMSLFVDTGWNITSVQCQGPRPAPTDDEQTIARAVTVVTQMNFPSSS